ncbi:hypothetical protein DSOL_0977 [Desulfosporosinus metallidurans]|uniref:Uncharacterized protein n=1 Tax=Desulfosporosinus metallidurans TaxID=1888891 RepID=A0A1Q8R1E0_9FIRM|nr:hypothetical protein DSOL_0977 [Desulfosporosinus metallidurans]
MTILVKRGELLRKKSAEKTKGSTGTVPVLPFVFSAFL